MRKIKYLLLLLTAFGCSKEEENALPVIDSANLTVQENSSTNTLVGNISASDPDGDAIEFKLVPEGELAPSDLPFKINSATGEIKVNKIYDIDYEASPFINITVEASDGKGSSERTFTVDIINEEDGPLSNEENEFLDYFIYLTFFDGPLLEPLNSLRKRSVNQKLYVFGSLVDNSFMNEVNDAVGTLNSAVSSQEITFSLTPNSQEATLSFFYGQPEEIENIWPSQYNSMINSVYDAGYSSGSKRIFMQPDISTDFDRRHHTIIHEILHHLGLGHSLDCEDTIMGATANDFGCYSNVVYPLSLSYKEQLCMDYLYNPYLLTTDNRQSTITKMTELLSED